MPKPTTKKAPLLTAIVLAPSHASCERAALILTTAHESAAALLKAYDLARMQRGKPRGMTTDNEQDLLRSMLVVAAAGIDAMAKQLISDSVALLVGVDERSQNTFEKFVQRRLVAEGAVAGQQGMKLLASALASPSPQARLIEEYRNYLTGGSLQSVDSLFEVAAGLGIDPNSIGLNPSKLKPIFEARNRIIHELDINLSSKRRTQNLRQQGQMITYVEQLFALGAAMIQSVDARLTAGGIPGTLATS